MIFKLTVPGNPIPKGRPRVVGRHAYTPKRTRDYESLVHSAAATEWQRQGLNDPLVNEIVVTLKFCRENHRRADLDNLIKAVLDALNGVAFEDDCQINYLSASKAYDHDNPRVEITVQSEV